MYGYNRQGVKNFAWTRKGEINECYWHDLIFTYYFVNLGMAYKDCEDVVTVMFSDIVDAFKLVDETFEKIGCNDNTAWYMSMAFSQLMYQQEQEEGLLIETLCTPSFYYKDELIKIELPCTPVADYLAEKREDGPQVLYAYKGDRAE